MLFSCLLDASPIFQKHNYAQVLQFTPAEKGHFKAQLDWYKTEKLCSLLYNHDEKTKYFQLKLLSTTYF